MNESREARVPLLFLVSDTGGGHRRAAVAVAGALEEMWPGRFAPLLHDPLMGEGAPWVVRRGAALYGPLTRLAPWVWGALYRASDSPRRVRALWRTVLAGVSHDIQKAMAHHRAAIVVSFHPLLTGPAVQVARATSPPTAVATVVTDLVRVHSAWLGGVPQLVAAPSGTAASHFSRTRCVETGLPVPAEWRRVVSAGQRTALRLIGGCTRARS